MAVSAKRHLAKTLTWRVLATTDTFIITYLLSKFFGIEQAVEVATGVASLEVVTKMILYYWHERLWYNYISFGVGNKSEKDEKG